jgi:hypothetical protein
MVIRYISSLKNALKTNSAYIDGVLIVRRKKGWSKMTKEEQGEYTALVELFNADKELSMYADQLFYALGKYPELNKALKAGTLDNAFAAKVFGKKINTTLDDYIKRTEDMIKGAESGKYTYTADDIYALLEELAEEGLPELIKDRKSLNMVVNPHGGSIDKAGRLDVFIDAVDRMRHSDAAVLSLGSPATRTDPILFNFRRLLTHLDNLPEAQVKKVKWSTTADDLDFWNGEDVPGFVDPSKNDYGLTLDRRFFSADDVVREARYEPTKAANFDFVMEGDVWPLPRKTGKTPKFEAEDIVSEGKNRLAILEERKTALEGRIAQGQGYTKSGERQLEQEGMAMMEEAQDALDEVLTEIDRLKMNGTTKKQGGGLIDSPLYLRDY